VRARSNIGVTLALAVVHGARAAEPSDYVLMPGVVYGERAIDVKAGSFSGPGDRNSAGSVALEYSPTNYWVTELYDAYARSGGMGTKFDAIVLTEGAGPRTSADTEAVNFLSAAARGGSILAALGAGEKALGCAGLLKGRRVSAPAEARRELQSLGAECIGDPVVVDGSTITAGSVDDIPASFRALLKALDASELKPAPSATRR